MMKLLFALLSVALAQDSMPPGVFFLPPTPEHNSELGLCVGEAEAKVSFEVRAVTTVVSQSAFKETIIDFSMDTVPLTAILSDNIYQGPRNTVSRTFTWQPTVAENPTNKRVCFQAVSVDPQAEAEKQYSPQQCVDVVVLNLPSFVPPTPMSPDLTINECGTENARINEELIFSVRASDSDETDQVSITVTVREDPGLPSGAMVEPNVCPSGNSEQAVVPCNPTQRIFRWTPDAQQGGRFYSIRFRADDGSSCHTSAEHCVVIRVLKPEPEWIPPTPVTGSTKTGYVGCTTSFCLQAHDKNNFYRVEIEEGTADEALPAGAVLGPAELFSEGTLIQRCFSWKPVRKQEGFMYEVKFYAGRVEDRITSVVRIDVQRCKYCVQPGESLQAIAADYSLNWLQLWGANVELRDPDNLATEQILSLCPVYYMKPEDGIDNLARRFSTTADHIISMNPDVEENMEDADLHPGQALCICPGVCKSTKYHFKQD